MSDCQLTADRSCRAAFQPSMSEKTCHSDSVKRRRWGARKNEAIIAKAVLDILPIAIAQ